MIVDDINAAARDGAQEAARLGANTFAYWRERSHAGLDMLGEGEADHSGLWTHQAGALAH